jgi:pyruvate dehydrogenase E1 component alpha subunit
MGDQGDTYGYRTQQEIEEWMRRCPIRRLRERLIAEELADASLLAQIDAEVRARIDDAVEFARQAPFPEPAEVFTDVYA